MKKYLTIALLVSSISIAACGGSEGNGNNGAGGDAGDISNVTGGGSETLSSTQKTRVGTQSAALASTLSTTLARAQPNQSTRSFNKATVSFDCVTSGTFSFDDVTLTITYDECTNEYDSDGDGNADTVSISDGTLAFEVNGDTQTVTYSLETSIEDRNNNISESSMMEGTQSINTATGTATMDISGDFDGDEFSIEGTMTLNGNDLTEDMCMTFDGESIECIIDDSNPLNVTTATPEDYANACSVVSSC